MIENKEKEAYLKNALVLAYLGDAVFNLLTRDFLVKSYNYKPNQLNKMANSVVCAKNQAAIMKDLKLILNEQELDIAMRARNTHLSNNKAKNSTIEEYSLATQFEAVVGFWYLNNEQVKINNMFKTFVIEKMENK